MKQLHGSDPTWGEENMKEKHIQLFQEQNPGLQDYLGSQCFHNYLPDLKVALDCLGFGLFVIVLGCLGWLGGAPPRFHSLWPFSRFTVRFLHCANRLGVIPQLPCATAILPQEPGKHSWVLRNWHWTEVQLSLFCSKVFSEHAVSMNVFWLSHMSEIPEAALNLPWTK